MTERPGRTVVIVGVGVCLAFAVLLYMAIVGLPREGDLRATDISVQNLADHPIYRRYDYGSAENVVDIGIQPLWVPTCIIAEVMRRDRVLKQELAERGLEIRFHAFLKGADVNFFLQRGDLEIGIGGDMPTLTAAAESGVLVTGLVQQGFCSIVARRHQLMAKLRGQRIAFALGSNAHYALLEALSSAGLREADVRLIALDVNEMPEALAEGEIDAFSAWEPTPTIALTRFDDQVVIHRSLSSGYLYFSRSFARRRPEVVRQIVAAELRAMYWLWEREENLLEASQWALEAGRDLSGQKPVLSARQYVALAKNDLLGLASLPLIPQTDLEAGGRLSNEFEFLKSLGRIPERAEWNDIRSCLDRKIMQEVMSQRREYQLLTWQYGDEGDSHP